MTTIARGNTGRLSVTFAPIVGTVALADVTCTITSPSAVATTLTVYQAGSNRFYADVVVSDFTGLGVWTVRWDSDPPSELITVHDTYTVIVAPVALGRRSNVGVTINRIRRQLDASVRHEYNRLGSSVLAADTVIYTDIEPQPSLRAGSLISIEAELIRVVTVNVAGHEITVIRGWQDSYAVDHPDAGEILVNPRWTLLDIKDAVVAEIASWAPRLFQVVSYQWATVTDSDEAIELPDAYADAIGVVSLRRQWDDETASNAWPELDFRLLRGDVGVWDRAVESGLLIRLLHNNGVARGGKVAALLAMPFQIGNTQLDDADDLVDDYGLVDSMLEIVELGVKMRLIGDAEIGRSARGQQDEPRRSEETPAGTASTLAQTIRSNYERRIGQEIRKLQSKYPMRAW